MKKYYFSRRPGKFVNENIGEEKKLEYKFGGTVHEWYEV